MTLKGDSEHHILSISIYYSYFWRWYMGTERQTPPPHSGLNTPAFETNYSIYTHEHVHDRRLYHTNFYTEL
jgi:hypothetical protein